jgi:hypothetical protein
MLTSNHPQSHPNVLRAAFVWYEQRTQEMFFLMDFIDGTDLQTWMNDERLYAGTAQEQEQRLALVAHQLGCALQHLHKLGILHQDVKPDNVLMTADGSPMLADVGVGSQGIFDGNVVTAVLRGGTPIYASPHVCKIFFEAKSLPRTERMAFLETNKITHVDDFFALGATIFNMFAECGWREGRSVADMLGTRSIVDLVGGAKQRVVVPECMLPVLQACFGDESTATTITVDAVVERLAGVLELKPLTLRDGLSDRHCTSIRNNLAVALYDDGVAKQADSSDTEAARCFQVALLQLEQAINGGGIDARTQNNLGVTKLALDKEDETALTCFEKALEVEPNHASATFNKAQIQRHLKASALQLDRTGAAGAMDDGRGKMELTGPVTFARTQQLEVHYGGRMGGWQKVPADSLGSQSLVALTYRIPTARASARGAGKMSALRVQYAPGTQLMVYDRCEWVLGRVGREVEKQLGRGQQVVDQQVVHVIDTATHGQLELELTAANHAPALFSDMSAMGRANQAYTIELKEKHAFILDLFSGQKLDTRTQTATLQYRESERAAQAFAKDDDVDSLPYQRARKASQMQRRVSTKGSGKDATEVLHTMLCGDNRAAGQLLRYLLLILGPAASGKTTLLKTFTMEIVHRYTDFVPVLIPVIEVLPVLLDCDRDAGQSVVAAFVQRKYPQHAHLLLQAMLQRRAVFFIDGIDESGTQRDAVQDFVTVELLEPGHKTVITSRHSGFSGDAFRQCQLVELLPLSDEQQARMVRTRVPDEEKAERLVRELGNEAFKDIATNPLILTMMVSIYVSNNYVVISNRSDLYEKALLTLMGRSDKGRGGLDRAAQDALFEHLQKLAAKSHQREGERRIFTAMQARTWAGTGGWAAIEKAMRAGRLPIIAAMGRNKDDEDEYRFGHMSYQEYLTGREYYQELTEARFSTAALVKLFGRQPLDAFTDVKQHLVLELLAGILSPEQRTMCLAVMCGGRVEVLVLMRKPSRKSATSTRCAVARCPEAHRNADGYCHNHREAAASALGNATVHGGDALTIEKDLGRAGMKALAPYVRDSTRLRTLVLSGVKLGKDGLEVLVQALETNTTVTALDLSKNDLKAEGAAVIAELLARCVRGCWFIF